MTAGHAFEALLVFFVALGAGWGVFRLVSLLRSRLAVALIWLSLFVLDLVRTFWIDLELPVAQSHWEPNGGDVVPITLGWACAALMGAKWGPLFVLITQARRAHDARK